MLWKYSPDVENYQTIGFTGRQDSKLFIYNFKGRPLPKPWPSIAVRYDKEWEDTSLTKAQRRFAQKYKDAPKGDFPSLPGLVPVFSQRAVDVFESMIKDSVEIIPLVHETEKLYLINVIDVVDCLDLERSTLKLFSNGGIMRVSHYEFKNTAQLAGKGMVKLQGQLVDIFVTDAFKIRAEEEHLQGLLWQPLP